MTTFESLEAVSTLCYMVWWAFWHASLATPRSLAIQSLIWVFLGRSFVDLIEVHNQLTWSMRDCLDNLGGPESISWKPLKPEWRFSWWWRNSICGQKIQSVPKSTLRRIKPLSTLFTQHCFWSMNSLHGKKSMAIRAHVHGNRWPYYVP